MKSLLIKPTSFFVQCLSMFNSWRYIFLDHTGQWHSNRLCRLCNAQGIYWRCRLIKNFLHNYRI